MDIGVPELIIILLVVVLLFGPGRIGKISGELGKGIRAFRDGISGKDSQEEKEPEVVKAAEEKEEAEVVKEADPEEKM
jgi:sec-independent protein translocase protein TatA